jgi:Zn ribbon nucleic-acid-binding protein
MASEAKGFGFTSLVQACDAGPSTRDRPVFYKAMFDETTLEIRYCVVCGLQKSPKDLEDYMWEDFYGLYVQVEPPLHPSERDHSM